MNLVNVLQSFLFQLIFHTCWIFPTTSALSDSLHHPHTDTATDRNKELPPNVTTIFTPCLSPPGIHTKNDNTTFTSVQISLNSSSSPSSISSTLLPSEISPNHINSTNNSSRSGPRSKTSLVSGRRNYLRGKKNLSLGTSSMSNNDSTTIPSLNPVSMSKSKTITILGLFELTKNSSRRLSGVSEKLAAELALHDINRKKILNKYRLTMLTNDTQVSITEHCYLCEFILISLLYLY